MKNRRKRQTKGQSKVPSELALLRRIEQAAARVQRQGSGIRLGIGDDAALWRPRAGFETVLTTDWFLEGSHFLRNVHPPDVVGWKSLARAMSDVAAMGGKPRCCLVSLALPQDCTKDWMDRFLKGLSRAERQLGCPLAGGDTTSFRNILINVCVIGEVKSGSAVKRSGASPGDRIFVSGRMGEAELGLAVMKERKTSLGAERALLQKHYYPVPRLALGNWLASHRLATAMMDISDGLSSDLARLCDASKVGARIFSEKLPMASSPFSRRFDMRERFNAALHGGDDYELLFCVNPRLVSRIPRRFAGVELTEIGEITKGRQIILMDSSGGQSTLKIGGWDPFRE